MRESTAQMLGYECCAAYDDGGVGIELLLRSSSSWDGTPYCEYPQGLPELNLLRIKIAANTALNWHIHPCPVAIYIISGDLVVELRDSDKHVRLIQGDVMAETINIVHRGISGDQGVELLAFYATVRGLALTVPQA